MNNFCLLPRFFDDPYYLPRSDIFASIWHESSLSCHRTRKSQISHSAVMIRRAIDIRVRPGISTLQEISADLDDADSTLVEWEIVPRDLCEY